MGLHAEANLTLHVCIGFSTNFDVQVQRIHTLYFYIYTGLKKQSNNDELEHTLHNKINCGKKYVYIYCLYSQAHILM